jgi:hypothetical protein
VDAVIVVLGVGDFSQGAVAMQALHDSPVAKFLSLRDALREVRSCLAHARLPQQELCIVHADFKMLGVAGQIAAKFQARSFILAFFEKNCGPTQMGPRGCRLARQYRLEKANWTLGMIGLSFRRRDCLAAEAKNQARHPTAAQGHRHLREEVSNANYPCLSPCRAAGLSLRNLLKLVPSLALWRFGLVF